jgi:hypothetical protein
LAKATFVVACLSTVVACEEPKEIGLAPTNEVGVLYTDTITITRTTAQMDSVRSHDQSVILAGRYADPVFGAVQARAYLSLRPGQSFVINDTNTTNATPANRIILDSTKVQLPFNRVWYGDTTATQEIVLSRLTDSLRSINYDISSPGPAIGQVVARRTFRPRPSQLDTAGYIDLIKVDNSLGRELIALANTDAARYVSGALVDPAGFRRQVRTDFVLSTNSPPQAAVLGFTGGDLAVIVYYHVQGERTAYQFTFPFIGKRFNQITATNRPAPLTTIRLGQSLAATTTGRTYVQPGTGITTKLQFPYLKQLLQSGRIAVNRADLIITPQPPEDGKLPLPPFMALAEIDGQNRLVRSTVAANNVERLFTVQSLGPVSRDPTSYLSPQLATLDPRTNSYTFQLAGYLQSVRAGISPNNGLAILTPSNALFAQSQGGGLIDQTQAVLSDRVWRMILDGKASVKLVVFYTKSN